MKQQRTGELQDKEGKHCNGGHMTLGVKKKKNQAMHCTMQSEPFCRPHTPAKNSALVLAQ